MSEQHADVLPKGRPVRLVPTAPGFWMTILGVCIAAIAPLFGFLFGSMAATPDEIVWLTPIYWGLFIGVVIGGAAVIMAVIGGVRLWKHYHPKNEIGVAEEPGV